MPLPDAIAASEQYRRALDARERAALTRLVRAYAGIARRLQTQVDALAADLDAALESGAELSAAKLGRYDRLRELQKQVAAEVTRYGAVAEAEMDGLTQAAVKQGANDAKALTQLSLPGMAALRATVMQQWQALPADAIETLLGFLGPDSPMRDALVTKLGPAVADQVGDALVTTLAMGVGPRKAAQVVQNIVREQLGKGLTWSLTTTRTAHMYAYREASRAAYAANPKIVKGWRWVSARDERTCGSCLAKDGSVHPVTETLNDHQNGRCRMVPIVPTYRDLGFDVDEAPPVLEHETGEAWFRAQSPATQKAILGPGKVDALNAGKFKFSDLSVPYDDPVYGQMAREATLAELVAGKGAVASATSATAVGAYGGRVGLDQALYQREIIIRNAPDEVGILFGQDGEEIAGAVGTPKGVKLTSEMIRNAEGNVYTHNHPGRDVAFSAGDMNIASKYNVSEMRAVTKDAVYVMRPRDQGWPKSTDILSTFYSQETKIRAEHRLLLERAQPLFDKGSFDYQLAHDISQRMAHAHNLDYSRTLWSDIPKGGGVPKPRALPQFKVGEKVYDRHGVAYTIKGRHPDNPENWIIHDSRVDRDLTVWSDLISRQK